MRREADAESLREAGSDRIVPLILDVTDAEQIAAAAQRIGAEVERSPRARRSLVNNAGVIGLPSPAGDDADRGLPPPDRGQPDRPGRGHPGRCFPRSATRAGRIVFVSSIGGRIAFPLTGAYHAAKFGIEAVGDVFRRELRRSGHFGLDRRAGLDRHRDLGSRRGGLRRDRRAVSPHATPVYGDAIERYRKRGQGRGEAGGSQPDKAARAIEHALAPDARAPATWSGWMPASMRSALLTELRIVRPAATYTGLTQTD